MAAILQRSNGQILIAERRDTPEAWQFPQGGIDEGEDETGALYREVEEELGIRRDLVRIRERRDGYRYRFAGDRIKHGIYRGQQQVYFLCDFAGSNGDIRLEVHEPEFGRFRWIDPRDFQIAWVPDFKKAVYRAVMRDFFGVDL